MKYYVKFSLDYYVENELAIFSYRYGYSNPVCTLSEAIRDQEMIRKGFMNHKSYAILECDENGLVTKNLQYGAWSAILLCGDKRAREITINNQIERECY